MDSFKLKTMSKWPILTKKKEVQAFLGFAYYYRRFIDNYSAKAHALIDMIKMFSSLGDMHNSKPSTNSKHDSYQLLSSPSSIELLRQSWKLMLAIKQLLVSYLNA